MYFPLPYSSNPFFSFTFISSVFFSHFQSIFDQPVESSDDDDFQSVQQSVSKNTMQGRSPCSLLTSVGTTTRRYLSILTRFKAQSLLYLMVPSANCKGMSKFFGKQSYDYRLGMMAVFICGDSNSAVATADYRLLIEAGPKVMNECFSLILDVRH